MLPFSIELRPGLPVAEQILFAVKKAAVNGQLRAGDKFPSVRVLSQELRINPNTAHKVVAALVAQGVIVTTPAVGSIVAERASGSRQDRADLLGSELERLVVEAKKLGLSCDEVKSGLTAHWKRLEAGGADPS
jgi:GntR family transcriptional regulator